MNSEMYSAPNSNRVRQFWVLAGCIYHYGLFAHKQQLKLKHHVYIQFKLSKAAEDALKPVFPSLSSRTNLTRQFLQIHETMLLSLLSWSRVWKSPKNSTLQKLLEVYRTQNWLKYFLKTSTTPGPHPHNGLYKAYFQVFSLFVAVQDRHKQWNSVNGALKLGRDIMWGLWAVSPHISPPAFITVLNILKKKKCF